MDTPRISVTAFHYNKRTGVSNPSPAFMSGSSEMIYVRRLDELVCVVAIYENMLN